MIFLGGSIENPEETSESNVADNDDTLLESGSLANAASSDCDDMDVNIGDLHDSRSISNASESSSIFDGQNDVDTSEESEDEDVSHDRNNCDDDPIMFEVSQLKESEVMEMITGICVRFNTSYELRKAIVDLIKCLAGPCYTNWKMTKHNIKKKYDPPDTVISYTFFCSACKFPLLGPVQNMEFANETAICQKCNHQQNHLSMRSENKFVYIDLEFQLKSLLTNTHIEESIMTFIHQRNARQNADYDGSISDISDSELYRRLNTKYSNEGYHHEYLLTYNFNTDGMPIFNSSKRSCWPILLYVNELPPKERFKHVLLVALWIGDKEPTPSMMDTFLQQFVQGALKLFKEGIIIKHGERRKIFKFAPLCCAVDSVARPVVQNRLQYNGYQGCSWCYANGTHLRGTVRYLFREDAELRSHESHLKDIADAQLLGKIIKGVKGDSIIFKLPEFNAVWGFSYDFMHGTLLGIQKQMAESSYNQGSPIYLSKLQRTKLNARLISIRPIKKIQRLPRPLTERCKWKASEWLSWSLFYCLPCYYGIIRNDVHEHLALLVSALFRLLQDHVTDEELNQCEIDLLRFVADFETLYGKECVTFNIHALLHMVQSVRMCGPLWATSTFNFESTNFHLKQQVSGPKGVEAQVCTKYLQKNLWKWQTDSGGKSEICRQYCKNLFATHKHTGTITVEETVLLGIGKQTVNGIRYERCICKGDYYHSSTYKPNKKTNDSAVQIHSDEYAEITAILQIGNECYFEIRKMITENVFNVPHIFRVNGYSENTTIIPICNVKKKIMFVTHAEGTYVCCTPHIFYM